MNVRPDSVIAPNATLLSATAVVVANHFNLSIFQPAWLLRNGILTEEELAQNVLISPGVISIPTPGFSLTILPERVQMQILPKAYARATDELLRVIGRIVRLLPHTPYVAVGLNFEVRLSPPSGTPFDDWNRGGYLAPKLANVRGLAARDARFGAYASYDLRGGRLKFNVLPKKASDTPAGEDNSRLTEHMHCGFNYHTHLPQPVEPEFLVGRLQLWEDIFAEVCNISASIV